MPSSLQPDPAGNAVDEMVTGSSGLGVAAGTGVGLCTCSGFAGARDGCVTRSARAAETLRAVALAMIDVWRPSKRS